MLRMILLVLISLGSLSPFGNAQEASPFDAPPFSLSPDQLRAAASVSEDDAKAPWVVLSLASEIRFDKEGRRSRKLHLIYLVQEEPRDGFAARIGEVWNTAVEQRPTVRARTITATGTEHWLAQSTIAEGPARNPVPGFVQELRSLEGPLPAVNKGSIVEMVVEAKETEPALRSGWVHRVPWVESGVGVAGNVPVLRSSKTVIFPKDLPVVAKPIRLPRVIRTEESSGAEKVIRFTHPRIGRMTGQSHPASPEASLSFVMISSGRSWQALAAEYQGVVKRAIAGASLATLSRVLERGAATRDEKIAAVASYIAREIRYTSVVLGSGTVIPRSTDEVLESKFGDCKDVSTLMVGLLAEMGIPASVALVSTLPILDADPLMPGMGFPHAIVYIPGKPALWIDPTQASVRAGATPAGLQGRTALIADSATQSLVTIPISGADENTLLIRRTLRAADMRSATAVEELEARGVSEELLRERLILALRASGDSGAKVWARDRGIGKPADGITLADAYDYRTALKARTEGGDPRFLRRGANWLELTVDWGDALAALEDQVPLALAETIARRQRKPTDTARANETLDGADEEAENLQAELRRTFVPQSATVVYDVEMPPGFAAAKLPQPVTKEAAGVRWTVEFESPAPHRLVARGTLDASVIPDAGELLKVAELCRDIRSERIVVRFEDDALRLISQDRAKEAFLALREAENISGESAATHLRWARALLAAGLGLDAHERARAAMKSAPDDLTTLYDSAFILNHNAVGTFFGEGWPRREALEAYERLLPLFSDPEQEVPDEDSPPQGVRLNDVKWRLAQALLNDENSRFFGPGSDPKRGLALLDEITKSDPDGEATAVHVMAWFAAERDDDVLRCQAEGCMSASLKSLALAAKAVTSGADEAMDLASTMGALTPQEIVQAATLATSRGKYLEAAMLLDKAAELDAQRAPMISTQASIYRQIADSPAPDSNDPRWVVREALRCVAFDELKPCLSKLLHPDASWESFFGPAVERVVLQVRGGLRVPEHGLRNHRFPFDLLWVSAGISVEQGAAGAARITYQTRAFPLPPISFLIFMDGETPKLAAMGADWAAAGERALKQIEAGNLKDARDLLLLAMGRDPDPPDSGFFDTRILDHFLAGENGNSAKNLEAAAYSLLRSPATVERGLTGMQTLLSGAPSGEFRSSLLWAIVQTLTERGSLADVGQVRKYAGELSKAIPDETLPSFYLSLVAAAEGKPEEIISLVATMERNPAIPSRKKLFMLWNLTMMAGDIDSTLRLLNEFAKEFSQGGEVPNGLAWAKLLAGDDLQNAKQMALRASVNDYSGNILHTLSCLQGITGETVKARRSLEESMLRRRSEDMNSGLQFAQGMIAEGAGLAEIAIRHYEAIEAPKVIDDFLVSLHAVAARRAERLKGAAAQTRGSIASP